MLYDEGGQGPPIVLLHGLMGGPRTWRRHTGWFAGFGQVHTFGAGGHGRPAPVPLRTEAFVADLASALASITEPVVLVGHSMGALHAWMFAAAHPARVRALVLEDMAPDFRGRTADGWAALVRSWPQPFPTASAVLKYFGPLAGQYFLDAFRREPEGYYLHGPAETFREISAEWGERSFWPQWDTVRAPALLLEAGHSITPPGQMWEMAQRHPDSSYTRIPGAGHLIHDERPGAYRAAVAPFLTGVLAAPIHRSQGR